MEACYNDDSVSDDTVEQTVRKSPKQRAAGVSVDDGVLLRMGRQRLEG